MRRKQKLRRILGHPLAEKLSVYRVYVSPWEGEKRMGQGARTAVLFSLCAHSQGLPLAFRMREKVLHRDQVLSAQAAQEDPCGRPRSSLRLYSSTLRGWILLLRSRNGSWHAKGGSYLKDCMQSSFPLTKNNHPELAHGSK